MKKEAFYLHLILILSIVCSPSFSSYIIAKSLVVSVNFINKSSYSLEAFLELENNVRIKHMVLKIPEDSKLVECKYLLNNVYEKECKIDNNLVLLEINDEVRSLKIKYKTLLKNTWILTDSYYLFISFPYIDLVRQKKVVIQDGGNVIKSVRVEECAEILEKGKKFEGVLCNYDPSVDIIVKYSMISFFGKKLSVDQFFTLLSLLIGIIVIFVIDYILYLRSLRSGI